MTYIGKNFCECLFIELTFHNRGKGLLKVCLCCEKKPQINFDKYTDRTSSYLILSYLKDYTGYKTLNLIRRISILSKLMCNRQKISGEFPSPHYPNISRMGKLTPK